MNREEKLRELLAEIHAGMPDVSEEETDRDIARAIREVRAQDAKEQGLVPPLSYCHLSSQTKLKKRK